MNGTFGTSSQVSSVEGILRYGNENLPKRWLFTDDTVEKLIYFLETVKVNMVWLVAKWSVANVQHAKRTLYMKDF